MAFEIYYTSATQGLKRGAQGFCTVAATDGIPAALLQRLESLSGYRHHFGPGDTSGGKNPVNHAHWTLNLSGKTYHVLSRISDAGVDYTHRTNSLAHHIALDANELPPAGPAWLLAQPGVMIDHWDGQVGPIVRNVPLPFWDMPPARCDAWQRVTGDAGWGGMLADALAKSTVKPVCILFTPDQDILELVDESIRLLPAALRWQATFNTYFTSMPQNVACAWRCCLVGTPAAQAAIRYAANGVVINLADPRSLGEAPANAWVEAARTGITPSGAAVKTPSTVARSAAIHAPVPQIILKPAPEPLLPTPQAQSYDELIAANLALKAASARRVKAEYQRKPEPEIRQNKDLNELARRNRRQMVLLYVAGVLAIGLAVLFLVHASHPADLPPPPPHPLTPVEPPTTSPITSHPAVEPIIPAVTQPAVATHPAPHPEIVPVVIKPPQPQPPPVFVPEQTIVLRGPLDYASNGGGLNDAIQDIDFGSGDAQRLRLVNSLRIAFPGERADYTYKHGDVSGILSAVPVNGAEPGLTVQWKDNATATQDTSDVLFVSLDKARGKIHITWRNSLLIRRPDVGVLAFWLVQESNILAGEPGKPMAHRIAFGPPEAQTIDLMDATTSIHFRCDLPSDCVLSGDAKQLPAGWTATPLPTPDTEPNSVVIQVLKPTRVTVLNSVIHVTVKSGWTTLATDFAQQSSQAEAGMDKFQKEVAQQDDQIKQLTSQADQEIADINKELTEKQALLRKPIAEIHDGGYPTKAALKQVVEDLTTEVQTRRTKLEDDKAPLAAKKNDFDQLSQGYQDVNAALNDLKAFDLSVALPDGTPIAVLHFMHK